MRRLGRASKGTCPPDSHVWPRRPKGPSCRPGCLPTPLVLVSVAVHPLLGAPVAMSVGVSSFASKLKSPKEKIVILLGAARAFVCHLPAKVLILANSGHFSSKLCTLIQQISFEPLFVHVAIARPGTSTSLKNCVSGANMLRRNSVATPPVA